MTKLTYRERRRIVRDYYRRCRKGRLDRLRRWVRTRLDSRDSSA